MVQFESDGSLTFRVYLPHATSVELVGDFTGWDRRPVGLLHEGRVPGCACESDRRLPADEPAERVEAGWWTLNLRVEDGDHAFSYLVDGHWTSLLFVPPLPRLMERLERRRERCVRDVGRVPATHAHAPAPIST